MGSQFHITTDFRRFEMSKGRVLALSVALAMGLSSAAALAEGDAKAGAKIFKKRLIAERDG